MPRVGFEPTTLRSLARLLGVDQPDALPSLYPNRLSYRGTNLGLTPFALKLLQTPEDLRP